ncbi:hypothetical protein LCGC14_1326990 [marine sediment metagenome]|uniref:Uncharacterized protein n=1 Tax=marine sediment metagenome TaxID=412755 RepID=A0A0F9MYP6_9ZZZZ
MDKQLVVGMADNATRKHYFEMYRGYPMRYCTMTSEIDQLVKMPGIEADCKRCLRKKKSFYDLDQIK